MVQKMSMITKIANTGPVNNYPIWMHSRITYNENNKNCEGSLRMPPEKMESVVIGSNIGQIETIKIWQKQ